MDNRLLTMPEQAFKNLLQLLTHYEVGKIERVFHNLLRENYNTELEDIIQNRLYLITERIMNGYEGSERIPRRTDNFKRDTNNKRPPPSGPSSGPSNDLAYQSKDQRLNNPTAYFGFGMQIYKKR